MVPLELETAAPPRPEPHSIASGRYWKEREDEFRKDDTPSNSGLAAQWHSLDESWAFQSLPGQRGQTLAPEQVFKPLAREAAKGLVGLGYDEPWLDWLDALRRATDRSTGTRLYSKTTSTGDFAIGEDHLDRMAKSGERIPRGGLIEFWVAPDPESAADDANQRGTPVNVRAETRTIWETTTETIECLFTSSANFCLELRSRIPPLDEAEPPPTMSRDTVRSATGGKTVIGRNVDRLRKECGWSFDDLAQRTGIDRSLILGHVNKGKGMHPRTLRIYADAFTKQGHPVTVAELEA
jgi:hypothetical protein